MSPAESQFYELCCAYNRQLHLHFGGKGPDLTQTFAREALAGGVSGGSCWGTDNLREFKEDIEDPGIGPVLDGFLEQHLPDISFLTYRKLIRLVRVEDRTDYEYYGNRSDYKIWTLSFKDAWSVLAPYFEGR